MANIGKNIKRLRAARGLTQLQLGDAVNVPRQTIAGWESGRIQPDLAHLVALSSALDSPPEALIYGKNRNVGVETEGDRRTLSIVLIIMGSLLLAVGLILLFVFFWQKLPDLTKTALALLPLLVGAGAGVFAAFRKKDGMAVREACAVLWCAGVIATNALINSLFQVDMGFENLLAADLLLLLPVMFLLDSVFAYVAETVMAFIYLLHDDLSEGAPFSYFVLLAVLTACGIYVFCNRQPAPVRKYCAWLGLLSAALFPTAITVGLLDDDGWVAVAMLGAFFLALYIAEETDRFDLHLRIPAQAVLCVGLFVLAIVFSEDFDFRHEFTFAEHVWELIWCVLCLVPAVVAGRRFFRKNPVKIAFTALFGTVLALLCIFPRIHYLLMCSFVLAAGALLVFTGVRERRLAAANLGMALLSADLVLFLTEISEADFLRIGLLLIVLGGVFLVANKVMIKKFNARKDPLPPAAEAPGDAIPAQTETEGSQNA